MDIKQAIELTKTFNQWRRGETDETLSMAPIDRKKNPHFDPKKLSFTDNVCIIDWRG